MRLALERGGVVMDDADMKMLFAAADITGDGKLVRVARGRGAARALPGGPGASGLPAGSAANGYVRGAYRHPGHAVSALRPPRCLTRSGPLCDLYLYPIQQADRLRAAASLTVWSNLPQAYEEFVAAMLGSDSFLDDKTVAQSLYALDQVGHFSTTFRDKLRAAVGCRVLLPALLECPLGMPSWRLGRVVAAWWEATHSGPFGWQSAAALPHVSPPHRPARSGPRRLRHSGGPRASAAARGHAAGRAAELPKSPAPCRALLHGGPSRNA
jgi:hypothetical protein